MLRKNYYDSGIAIDAYVFSEKTKTKLTLRDYFLKCLFIASRNHTTFDNSVVDYVVNSICDLAKVAMLSQMSPPVGADFDNDLTYEVDETVFSGMDFDITANDSRVVTDTKTGMKILFFVTNNMSNHMSSDSSNVGNQLYDAVYTWFGGKSEMPLIDWLRHMTLWDISIYNYPFSAAVNKQIDAATVALKNRLLQTSDACYHIGRTR